MEIKLLTLQSAELSRESKAREGTTVVFFFRFKKIFFCINIAKVPLPLSGPLLFLFIFFKYLWLSSFTFWGAALFS